MRYSSSVVFFFVSLLAASRASPVVISNVSPRRDTAGAILDAHDSKIVLVGGVYHWFAASYGNCTEPAGNSGCASVAIGACGFQTNHNVTLYTSPDLVTWTNQGVVFGAAGVLPPQSVLFAPKTVYNARTQTWVMWFNYITETFANSFYGVATSASPTGPFAVVNRDVALRFQDNGDENIFVDDDGTGYVIYTTLSQGHAMSIERLSENFTTSLGAAASSGTFGDAGVEAPMMFKRGAIYYALFGSCCCYCGSGSQVSVYTAAAALGPYTKQAGGPLPNLFSQSTDIFNYVDAAGETNFLYVGDHWQSAPDRLKSHDFTVWAPLSFADNGALSSKGFQDSFTVDVAPAGE
jgi:beta-xylosidase